MRTFSAKNQVAIIAAAWLVLSALNFAYFFGILDSRNQEFVNSMEQQKQILASLQAERESEKLAEKDLQKLAKEVYLPENFFSRDVTLVNELETLENLGKKLNVKMLPSGIAGTVSTAPKAKTITDLAVIRYNMSLNGSLQNVVNFIESMENLSFISNIESVSISAVDNQTVSATLPANFYLRK